MEKFAAVGKMIHTWKKWVMLEKNRLQLDKCAVLGKCAVFGKMGHTWKNVRHLQKCATLGNMSHTWKNMPRLEKWLIALLKKKNEAYFKNYSHSKK